jgi:hypothetical protein
VGVPAVTKYLQRILHLRNTVTWNEQEHCPLCIQLSWKPRRDFIISNPNLVNFKNNLISSFKQLNAWFNINLLSLNYNKTQYIQFRTTNSQIIQLYISYNNRYITNDTNTRFLGIIIDSPLSWKHHIDGLMCKLGRVSYAIRSLRLCVPGISCYFTLIVLHSYIQKVEVAGSSRKMVNIHQISWCHIPEDSNVHGYWSISYFIIFFGRPESRMELYEEV